MVGGAYDFLSSGVYGCAFFSEDEGKTIKITIYNYKGFGKEFRNPIINELEVNLKLKELSDSDETYLRFFPIISNEPIYINNDGEIVSEKGEPIETTRNSSSIRLKKEMYTDFIKRCNSNTSIFSRHTKGKTTTLEGLIYVLLEMPYGGQTIESYFEDLNDKKRCTPGCKDFNFKEVFEPIINKVLLGLQKLHDSDIYHGDLHFGNILYDDKKTSDIKIIDFGKSIILSKLGDKREKEQYFRAVLEHILDDSLSKDHEGTYKELIDHIIAIPDCYRIIDLIKLQQEILITICLNRIYPPEQNVTSKTRDALLFLFIKWIVDDVIKEPEGIKKLYRFPRRIDTDKLF